MHGSLFVRILECIRNFAKNLRRFLHRQLALSCESRPKIFSGNERHRVVQKRSFRAGGEKWNDMRMLKASGELYLSPEPIDVDSRGEIRRENFYDNLSIEVNLGRNEYARHSRAAELTIDTVGGADNFLKLALEV
jgi:hypothetical protein